MIDTNLIKDDPQMVAKNLLSRNYDLNIESYESLELSEKSIKPKQKICKLNAIASPKNMDYLKKRARMTLHSIRRLSLSRLSLINAQVN